MHFPTWVDLKGEDAVPETVHHVVVTVDPRADNSWTSLRRHTPTDGVHLKDGVRPGNNTPGGRDVLFYVIFLIIAVGDLANNFKYLMKYNFPLSFSLYLTETLSEAVKMLKGEYCIHAIDTHKMDKALIFCRTKLDCDNLERYFNQIGRYKLYCVFSFLMSR